MAKINNPHDKFFKQSMQQPILARQFMQHYLPPRIASALDLDSLVYQDASYINNQLSSAFSDVVFSCKLEGQEATISLLIEHQSKPDRFMPVRIGHYLFSLLTRQLHEKPNTLLPAAHCLVFYHGKQYPYSLSLSDCFNDPLGIMKNLFSQPLQIVDVSQLPDEELRQQELVGAFAQAMKHIRDADIGPVVIEIFDRFNTDQQFDPVRLAFIIKLLEYAMSVGNTQDTTWENVIEHVEHAHNEFGDNIMTLAERLRQQGFERGVAQGIEQGIEQGKALALQSKKDVARRLLDRGFSVGEAAQIADLDEALVAELVKSH